MSKLSKVQEDIVTELCGTTVVLLVKYDRSCNRIEAAFIQSKNLRYDPNQNLYLRRIKPRTAEVIIDGGYVFPNGTNSVGYTEYLKKVN